MPLMHEEAAIDDRRGRSWFSGSGSGSRTADGCSVDLYRRMAYWGEFDEAPVAFGPGLRVLDLGCGAGRLTRWLLDRGCVVTAVDHSAEMLAQVPAAATCVHADIQSLELGASFDCILLSSNLVNHPDASTRIALLRAARRHLFAGGRVLVQSMSPQWLATAVIGPAGERDGLALFVEAVERDADVVTMTLRYTIGDEAWRHSFTVAAVDEPAVERELRDAGFESFAWFGAGRRWVAATAT